MQWYDHSGVKVPAHAAGASCPVCVVHSIAGQLQVDHSVTLGDVEAPRHHICILRTFSLLLQLLVLSFRAGAAPNQSQSCCVHQLGPFNQALWQNAADSCSRAGYAGNWLQLAGLLPWSWHQDNLQSLEVCKTQQS